MTDEIQWKFWPYNEEAIREAEEYITVLLQSGQSNIELLRTHNEVDKKMLYYLWMSKDIQLKLKRKMTYPLRITKDATDDFFVKMESEKKKASTYWDTYDGQNAHYEICYKKWGYIVIAVQKQPTEWRKKAAWWYWISLMRNEAPDFYDYCLENLKKYED